MRRRTIPLTAAIAAVLMAGTTAATAASVETQEVTTATVTVGGMVFVPAALEGDVTVPQSPTETFTVSAPAAQFDAVLEQRVRDAGARIRKTMNSRTGIGVVRPEISNTIFGNCGSSYVILQSTVSQTQGQGYVKVGFDLTGVVSASNYDTDVLLFSTSHTDGWTAHVPESGHLGGVTRWSNDTRFDIPKTQKYGATFIRGDVQVTWPNGHPGNCWTGGPRVDGLQLYKS
ncbi:hypothetical protein ACWFNE_10120 [Cellulomonas sp. NPDC055163]